MIESESGFARGELDGMFDAASRLLSSLMKISDGSSSIRNAVLSLNRLHSAFTGQVITFPQPNR